ncbi:hypothetical protein CEXT_67101 [Caerostris extrusa]|uniref:Uncharacterized protein n=1 Tax=Caerostris extrusa TaxID=172846 RepID=A0AAV4XYG5_CAEEX|nr:hypothetical protein CEXT_67101 [Caerostris extrusa]
MGLISLIKINNFRNPKLELHNGNGGLAYWDDMHMICQGEIPRELLLRTESMSKSKQMLKIVTGNVRTIGNTRQVTNEKANYK